MKKLGLGLVLLITAISTLGCGGSGYNSKEAIKRGDVVTRPDRVENLARFETFLENISNKKEDKIRVTGYTHEGEPIFEDLHYDGKELHYSHDNTNDKHSGDNKGIEKDVCTDILKKENEQGKVAFYVSGCAEMEERELLSVEAGALQPQE